MIGYWVGEAHFISSLWSLVEDRMNETNRGDGEKRERVKTVTPAPYQKQKQNELSRGVDQWILFMIKKKKQTADIEILLWQEMWITDTLFSISSFTCLQMIACRRTSLVIYLSCLLIKAGNNALTLHGCNVYRLSYLSRGKNNGCRCDTTVLMWNTTDGHLMLVLKLCIYLLSKKYAIIFSFWFMWAPDSHCFFIIFLN